MYRLSVSVTMLAATIDNIDIHILKQPRIPLGYSWHFQRIHCVKFTENANIC